MPFAMLEALPVPVVLVPGLTCSPRLYAEQIPALWRFGPVTVADHRCDDSMAAIARRILAFAPPRFALAGLSMGGYIAFEIMRQAPERVAKLALLDTGARGETPEQTERRKVAIALAKAGRYAEVADIAFPIYVHRNRHQDETLKRVGARYGGGYRRGSVPASAAGHHEPSGLAARARGDQMPNVGSRRR